MPKVSSVPVKSAANGNIDNEAPPSARKINHFIIKIKYIKDYFNRDTRLEEFLRSFQTAVNIILSPPGQ